MDFPSSSWWRENTPSFAIWYVRYGCVGDDFHQLMNLLRLAGFCPVFQRALSSVKGWMLNVVLFAFSYSVSLERLHSLWNTEATSHHSDKLYVVLLFIFLNTAVSSILLFCDRYLCVGLWGKLFHSFSIIFLQFGCQHSC